MPNTSSTLTTRGAAWSAVARNGVMNVYAAGHRLFHPELRQEHSHQDQREECKPRGRRECDPPPEPPAHEGGDRHPEHNRERNPGKDHRPGPSGTRLGNQAPSDTRADRPEPADCCTEQEPRDQHHGEVRCRSRQRIAECEQPGHQ
jgi:hypothetical protein